MKGTKWFNNCYSKKESVSTNGTGRECWINITEVCSWWGYTQERSIHQLICWVTEIISASDWSKPSVNRNLGWNVPLTAFLKVQRLFISASGSQLTSWCGWACPARAPQSPQWVPRALPGPWHLEVGWSLVAGECPFTTQVYSCCNSLSGKR